MLARELGKTVAELDDALGPNELVYWRVYLERRPPAELADWIRYALGIRQFIGLHTPKGERLPKLQDLIPSLDL